MPEEDKNAILSSLPPKDRFALLESLSYPEDTAARLMQREFTAIPSNWSVGQTIDYLRENKDLPEEFLEIFIVNEDFKPIGTVPSSRVLATPPDQKGTQKLLKLSFYQTYQLSTLQNFLKEIVVHFEQLKLKM